MKFEEALIELRKGKRIQRKCYPYHYLDKNCDTLCDILAEDWEVMKEPGKTFPEVFEAFKEGKKIRRKSWDKTAYCFRDPVDALTHENILSTDWEIIE